VESIPVNITMSTHLGTEMDYRYSDTFIISLLAPTGARIPGNLDIFG